MMRRIGSVGSMHDTTFKSSLFPQFSFIECKFSDLHFPDVFIKSRLFLILPLIPGPGKGSQITENKCDKEVILILISDEQQGIKSNLKCFPGEEEACMAVLNNFYGDGKFWPGFIDKLNKIWFCDENIQCRKISCLDPSFFFF